MSVKELFSITYTLYFPLTGYVKIYHLKKQNKRKESRADMYPPTNKLITVYPPN